MVNVIGIFSFEHKINDFMTEQEAYIALNMISGIGARTLHNAIECFGNAKALFSCSITDLERIQGVSKTKAESIFASLSTIKWEEEIEKAQKKNVKLITLIDQDYPELLKRIYNPPIVLYVVGNVEALKQTSIAIVGTRGPTIYGKNCASKIAYGLAQSGVCIVSGLARGIDTEAHKAALQANGTTVAVIGSSLDKLYPKENIDLAREIINKGGAIVSEYPFGTPGTTQTFPMRNRIISGMSYGVLIVEAAQKSGAMITANAALDQNRTLMAIPGRIDNELASGPNSLIKDGATMILCVSDILQEINNSSINQIETQIDNKPIKNTISKPSTADDSNKKPKQFVKLDETEEKILKFIGTEETTADMIINTSGIPAYLIGPRIISLEIKGLIERLPGNILRAKQ